MDGPVETALFAFPKDFAKDDQGNLYVADSGNHTVRKITPQGVVTTLAGNPSFSGSADGKGASARFFQVSGIATDGDGNVYVTDDNHLVAVTYVDPTLTPQSTTVKAVHVTQLRDAVE